MYQIVFKAHIVISAITFSLGLAAIIYAIILHRKNHTYRSSNQVLGRSFVATMYAQLVLGFTMYYYPWSDKTGMEVNPIDPGGSFRIRFWEIEHVAIMVFALFLVQIGCVFISKTKSSGKKFVLTYWYFGVPVLLMTFTMIMAMR